MNAVQSRWRRIAVKLVQHASRVLPGARSQWADAMRRELDYIEDDPAALRWAFGCVLASYRTRLAHRAGFGAQGRWQHAATSGVLMLLIGFALLENAGGQTQPPRPAVDKTACELASASPGTRPEVPPHFDSPEDCLHSRVSPCESQAEAAQSLLRAKAAADFTGRTEHAADASCADRIADPLRPAISDTPTVEKPIGKMREQ